MSIKVAKSVIYMVGITGVGYLLMKVVAPSAEEMRKKLGLQNEVALTDKQKYNKLTMDRMKMAAGLAVETSESKK